MQAFLQVFPLTLDLNIHVLYHIQLYYIYIYICRSFRASEKSAGGFFFPLVFQGRLEITEDHDLRRSLRSECGWPVVLSLFALRVALVAESIQTDGVKVEKTKGGKSKDKGEHDGGF